MCRYIGSLTSITYQRAKHYSSISLSNNSFYLVNTNTYIYQAVEGPCGKSIPNDLFQQVLSVSDKLTLSMFVPNSGPCYYLINKYCLCLRKMKVFFLNLKFFSSIILRLNLYRRYPFVLWHTDLFDIQQIYVMCQHSTVCTISDTYLLTALYLF